MLRAPTTPWAQRQPVLKRYVRWLVHGCGVTQAATARVLNSTGQRTAKGRLWEPATVSALLNGRYDSGGLLANFLSADHPAWHARRVMAYFAITPTQVYRDDDGSALPSLLSFTIIAPVVEQQGTEVVGRIDVAGTRRRAPPFLSAKQVASLVADHANQMLKSDVTPVRMMRTTGVVPAWRDARYVRQQG